MSSCLVYLLVVLTVFIGLAFVYVVMYLYRKVLCLFSNVLPECSSPNRFTSAAIVFPSFATSQESVQREAVGHFPHSAVSGVNYKMALSAFFFHSF